MKFLCFTVFGLLFVSCSSEKRESYGPKCLSCTGARDPSECMKSTTCWASQKCYTERYTHADGHLLYDFGCKNREVCAALPGSRNRRVDITIDLCEECCEGEFCNVNTCVIGTANSSSVCYTCEHENHINDCHKLTLCSPAEICYAEKVTIDLDHPRYTMGCLSKQVCTYLIKGPQLIGKRSNHLCQKCCSTSGCNIDICGDNQPQQTTHMVTQDRTISTRLGHETTSAMSAASTTTPTFSSSQYVRLVNGLSNSEGRVEIFNNGQWGTICDDGFGTEEASVVCHMLGYSRQNAAASPSARFGQGIGNIWLDNVVCIGNEATITNCAHSEPIGTNNCGHSEDVGVTCSVSAKYVRLVNGSSNSEGRVEIFYNGQWGTVCDDGFGSKEAGVVCDMLAYSREDAVHYGQAYFGQGSGQIWMDNVNCTGDENDIVKCAHLTLGSHNCHHNEDVGVKCAINVRLINGSLGREGRVEIFLDNQWGTICDDNFDYKDAGVVCHMLGYPREAAVAWQGAHFGQGVGNIWLDDVTCHGNENNILNCAHKPPGTNNCQHTEDVGVTCALPSGPPASLSCPIGFVTHNDSCYLFDNTTTVKTYIQAQAECSKHSATLVDVETLEERDFIVGVVKTITDSTGEWLTGAKYLNSRWVWNDLQTPIQSDVTHGLRNGPCLSFVTDYHPWTDVTCDDSDRNYICEIKPV